MKTLEPLKSLPRPLLKAGIFIFLMLLVFGVVQQCSVTSLENQIQEFKDRIDALPATVASKKPLEQQVTALEQEIDALPAKVASKKQLNQQIAELKKQIDALPATVDSPSQLDLEKYRLTLEKDRVNAQNAIFGWLVQAVGGAFFVVTAYFTYRNVRAIEANVKAAEANVKATGEKQVIERFSKAVELLGSEKLEVRLGGIYALERIANNSEKDYWQVIEVLTAYIREKAPYLPIKKNEGVPFRLHNTESVEGQEEDIPAIPTDIQAVLTVIARRRYAFAEGEEHFLDLSKTNLCGADLKEANLRRVNLREANLQSAIFRKSNLELANLRGANLQSADFDEASLQSADLDEANLQRATLWEANLQQATLIKANLELAILVGANLQSADLKEANLQRVTLMEANLRKVNLMGAKLQQARLTGAIFKDVTFLDSVVGLTREQVSQIDQDQSNINEAMLPDYLRTPELPQPPDPQQA